ncbi:MAG: cation:proton antiporter [Candidatus Fermentibacteraceae bacterium]|nr:cation:proton antiporter [Candidatus Fermentibacteraceae bacterium]MBN2609905.1 cation:proton antiporter [Candidatus Fermentibacteraceae bacterium]
MDSIPILVIIGVATIAALYSGKTVRKAGLPSLLGYMILGVIIGSSVLSLIGETELVSLQFVTEIALGFVAFTIGAELNFRVLKRLGTGIILIILAESFAAFTIVFLAVYLFCGDLPLALLFGALAPASAPAGTVAVIQEYKARGNLTKALYAVVGFDDGLAVIIFGFAAALSTRLLQAEASVVTGGLLQGILEPLGEVGLSLLTGVVVGYLFSTLARRLKPVSEAPSLIFGFIALTVGLCQWLGISLILTCMVVGMVLANTTSTVSVRNIVGQLRDYMHLLFILFFFIAGAHLKISALPALGTLGIIYIFARAGGLMGGAWLGAVVGRSESKIRKYLGLGILSQAGVAIGLSLLVQQFCTEIGTRHSLEIGAVVITTITATSIVFEIVGPICAKYALSRAGEIPSEKED